MKRTIKNPTTGQEVEGEVVEIEEIIEKPIRIVLADGTELRLKTDVVEVVRVRGKWDQEGHPVYSVKTGNLLAVLDSPKRLRRAAGNNGG